MIKKYFPNHYVFKGLGPTLIMQAHFIDMNFLKNIQHIKIGYNNPIVPSFISKNSKYFYF
jgi:hypothetical protein